MEKELFFKYVMENMSDGTILKMENGGYYLCDGSLVLGKFDKNGLKIYYTKEKK